MSLFQHCFIVLMISGWMLYTIDLIRDVVTKRDDESRNRLFVQWPARNAVVIIVSIIYYIFTRIQNP